MTDLAEASQAANAVVVPKDAAPPASRHAWTTPRRIWMGGAAAAMVLIVAGGAWWSISSGKDVHYVTSPIARGDVTRTVTATGTVNPVLTVLVGSYVSGVIQELFCDYNTTVKRGQVCAKIDPRPYQALVDQQKANLDVAKAQLAKDDASLVYAKAAFARDSDLLKRGIVSQEIWDATKSALGQAQAQIELDNATIKQRTGELAAGQVNLDYTEIKSPVDGTVVSRNVTMGQTVAASFQTPTLFLIATDLTKMEVDTNISESDIGGLKVAQKASFTVEAYPSQVFQAAVTQVRQSPQTVQNVVTYDVVVSVGNDLLLLKPGMTATTRIITDARAGVLRVPNQSLRYVPRGMPAGLSGPAAGKTASGASTLPNHVWVLRNGKPEQAAVAVGIDDDNWTEITGGQLNAGDLVIVSEQDATASAKKSTPPPKL